MHQALKLETFDDFSIDPETGEILDGEDRRDAITTDLPRIARALSAIERKIEITERFKQEEIARLSTHCDHKTGMLDAQRLRLMATAEQLHGTSGQKRLDYPGLGAFSVHKGRAKLNSTDFDNASREVQEQAAMLEPDLIKSTTTLKPDKKAIKKLLEEHDFATEAALIKLFQVVIGPDKFVFKRED